MTQLLVDQFSPVDLLGDVKASSTPLTSVHCGLLLNLLLAVDENSCMVNTRTNCSLDAAAEMVRSCELNYLVVFDMDDTLALGHATNALDAQMVGAAKYFPNPKALWGLIRSLLVGGMTVAVATFGGSMPLVRYIFTLLPVIAGEPDFWANHLGLQQKLIFCVTDLHRNPAVGKNEHLASLLAYAKTNGLLEADGGALMYDDSENSWKRAAETAAKVYFVFVGRPPTGTQVSPLVWALEHPEYARHTKITPFNHDEITAGFTEASAAPPTPRKRKAPPRPYSPLGSARTSLFG